MAWRTRQSDWVPAVQVNGHGPRLDHKESIAAVPLPTHQYSSTIITVLRVEKQLVIPTFFTITDFAGTVLLVNSLATWDK